MILVNKKFAPKTTVISTTTTTGDNSTGMLEEIVIQTHQPLRPREFSSCNIAGVYIPPLSDAESRQVLKSLNSLVGDAKFARGIESNPLIFVTGEFNKCATGSINTSHGLRRLKKKFTRGKNLLD